MEQGKGPLNESSDHSMDFKDGFRYDTLEPGADSPDKKKWGVEIEFDKEKGQRTYTDFTFTNSGLLGGVLDTDNISANDVGDGISDNGDYKDPNYKATSEIEITASRQQRNLNLNATEEDLKHINSIDTNNTTMAWEGKYKKDNTNTPRATQGTSAVFSFTVNPWPNENDSLELMKLNGEYKEKVFVQGQEFDTGIKIDNIDDNARERLVGQVYHPTTGEIVPGASAYIGENGTIHIKMPKGALKKDPTGLKYVVDDESIFSTDAYKGLQNLDVKFFARPRTADEFKAIVEANGGYGYYTETGAGTEKINHDGKDVVIDKQGIDRYDHYNLIGGFKLNLDDTRYYTQKFIDGNNEETDDHKFSRVFPGQDFEVKINDPTADETDKTRKTGSEMDDAYKDGQASGKLNDEFLEVANRQIAENFFKIHAPKNAKAGDFLAVPVEYTYTNGSTDTHWFHFVVQETNNNRPEYLAEVGPQGNTLVNNPIVPKKEQDLKKNQPESYELIGNTFKDNKGNVWNVSIDQTTGAVTATLPLGKEINGGEKLTVPVKVKYTDQTTGEKRTEEIKAQFIATKQHKTQTSEKLTSEIPFETKVEYDPNLPEGYFQEF
ncbi:MAG: adhesin domain containing protein, partial [Anaerococcus prevotii]|nr:adhesin domain containing protein [Anaerococcus prevotii]